MTEPALYLHDKKMRIVNIKLDWAEQVLDSGVVGIASIDKIFVSSPDDNL